MAEAYEVFGGGSSKVVELSCCWRHCSVTWIICIQVTVEAYDALIGGSDMFEWEQEWSSDGVKVFVHKYANLFCYAKYKLQYFVFHSPANSSPNAPDSSLSLQVISFRAEAQIWLLCWQFLWSSVTRRTKSPFFRSINSISSHVNNLKGDKEMYNMFILKNYTTIKKLHSLQTFFKHDGNQSFITFLMGWSSSGSGFERDSPLSSKTIPFFCLFDPEASDSLRLNL